MIKVWDYLKEYESEREEVLSAIETVLESGWLILGEQVKSFEQEFSAYCGARFGIGVNNGTDAIFLGLKALGVGAGDEVITVANTAVPTVSAIAATGATPRLVDIDPATYLMDLDGLEKTITGKTKCIVVVHLFGQCVDMDAINKMAKRHSIVVMEDCAQAHGAQFEGKMAGSMSDISTFSFYPTKTLGGYGDAGMIVTSSEELDAKCRRLRFYGMEAQYYAIEDGYNSRLDELHAAILRKKLLHLDTYVERRRELAQMYDKELAGTSLTLPVTASGNYHSYYLYVARHPQRDRILEAMKAEDILLNVSYKWPIHVMPAYDGLGYDVGDLPVCEAAANEIFSLPMYPSLTNEELLHTCDVLKQVLSQIDQ